MEPFVTITRLTAPHASCHKVVAEQKNAGSDGFRRCACGWAGKIGQVVRGSFGGRAQAGFGDSGCSGAAFAGGMSFR